MIEIVLLAIVVILNVILVIDKAPTFKRILGQNKQMERDLYSARNDNRALASELRLYKTDLDRANGKIAGLEIQLETSHREVDHWMQESIARKNLLIARGIERG